MSKNDTEKQNRLQQLSKELSKLANEFAMNGQGTVAFELHGSSNKIMAAINILENGDSPEVRRKQMMEWTWNQPGLVSLLTKTSDEISDQ